MGYGYLTPFGFKGLVDGRWMLFVTESEYHEYLNEVVEKAKKQIADEFDDKLDDLLEEFNGTLQNVGKIYTSIAKSFSKEA